MNERERYLSALRFEEPDRVPFEPGAGRKSTLEAWHRQGLPVGVEDYHAYVRHPLGIEPASPSQPIDSEVDFRMIPQFEEKVLERRLAPPASTAPGSLIVQD